MSQTLTWTSPANFSGSIVWDHKLWTVDSQINSVTAANDTISVSVGDLKSNLLFNLSPENNNNHLQLCTEVSWNISPEDLLNSVGNGGIPNVNLITENGRTIGIQITGGLNFQFYWPGQVYYVQGDSTFLGDFTIKVSNAGGGLTGQANVAVSFSSIGNVVEIDPVINLNSGNGGGGGGAAATLLHLAVVLLFIVALFLASLV